jgi:hypothetical protein
MSVGLVRGFEPPVEEGRYLLDSSNARGWSGPSGSVEIVIHENGGKPWPWCYWMPTKGNKRPRCGMPMSRMNGASWIGPLVEEPN